MRLIKLLGLAAIMAMAAAAFIGTSSASALHRYVLCKTPAWFLCPAGNLVALLGRYLYPLRGVMKFKGGMFTEECTSGMIEGEETEEELSTEGGLEDTWESFTASSCKPCTSVKANTPVKTQVDMLSEEEEEPNWLMSISNFSVTFEGCPLGVKCKFGSSKIEPTIEMSKEEQKFNTNGAVLTLQEGSTMTCGSSVEWNAVHAWVLTLHFGGGEETVWDSLRP